MCAALLLAVSTLSTFYTVPECWELKLRLAVPRIYDNATSQGSRKYQWQTLHGYFTVQNVPGSEPILEFCSLENQTHKVNGRPVTYDAWVDEGQLWHGIGSNRTGVFKTRSVTFRLWAEPSYAIGPEPTEDNSLIVTLSGYGNGTANQLRGSAAGQIGCGCHEYGHVSPTRIWGQDTVVDTAAVFGTWRAKFLK